MSKKRGQQHKKSAANRRQKRLLQGPAPGVPRSSQPQFGPPPPRLPGGSPQLTALCELLASGQSPVVLEIEPVPGAQPLDCTANIERVIAARGGAVEYGWQLWETLPTVMIEAEFHAVWVDPDGNYRDVTPKEMPGIKQILFLPDPALVYGGRQIDNVRVPLRDDALIKDFIKAAEQYYEATNRGELADYHGPMALSPEMRTLMGRLLKLQELIVQTYYSR